MAAFLSEITAAARIALTVYDLGFSKYQIPRKQRRKLQGLHSNRLQIKNTQTLGRMFVYSKSISKQSKQ
jgi:hypothetical protein